MEHLGKLVLLQLASILVGFSFVERHKAARSEVRDRWWKGPVRGTMALLGFGVVGVNVWYVGSTNSPWQHEWRLGERVAVVIAILGATLRLWAMNTLGRLFTFEVSVREGHTLITTGPYRYLLHPSYSGGLMGLVGLLWMLGGPGLLFRSWKFWAFAFPIGLVAISLRIVNEEQVLAMHFASEWNKYRSGRWRLVPFLW